MKPKKIELVFYFLLILLLNTGLQYYWGAQTSELWHTDDGSHYISGTLIKAWIQAGFPQPMRFAYDFNAHYPTVGIGLWGPAFYVVEGIWQLIFGGSKAASLLLSASVGAALATYIYNLGSQRTEKISAFIFSLIFCLSPLTIEGIIAIGLDLPMALFCFFSAMAFNDYLKNQTPKQLFLFSSLIIFCLYIKGNAFALGLFVPAALLLNRQLSLLRSKAFWFAGIMMIAIALPWYLLTYKMAASGFRHAWGIDFLMLALPQNGQILVSAIGIAALPLLVAGILKNLFSPDDPLGKTILALFIAVFAFQSIVPASINPRYLLPLLAPALLLCNDGWHAIRSAITQHLPYANRKLIAILPLFIPFGLFLQKYPDQKTNHGLIEAARFITHENAPATKSILIAAFDVGETAFVAETAMASDGRMEPYVIRGSRLLAGGGYNNFEYETPYKTSREIAERIDDYKIPIIVIATGGRAAEWEHIALLDKFLESQKHPWKLAWRYSGGQDVRVYVNPDYSENQPDHTQLKALTQPKKMDMGQ